MMSIFTEANIRLVLTIIVIIVLIVIIIRFRVPKNVEEESFEKKEKSKREE